MIACIILTVVMGLGYIFKLPVQLVPTSSWTYHGLLQLARGCAGGSRSTIARTARKHCLQAQCLVNLEASATYGRSTIVLTFDQKTGIETAMLELVNSLNSVAGYPADADEPVVVVGRRQQCHGYLLVVHSPGRRQSRIRTQLPHLIEQVVQPRIERIEGVASTRLIGGRKQVLEIEVDPYKAAQFVLKFRHWPACWAATKMSLPVPSTWAAAS